MGEKGSSMYEGALISSLLLINVFNCEISFFKFYYLITMCITIVQILYNFQNSKNYYRKVK
jgi:hypothetical protein